VNPVPRLLGPEGPLAAALPGYEARAGQLEMAVQVERALAEERVLLCEAGTGTGKTLAYLVPAILSGKKVVVSTATRALQEQIVTRDLPLIERALGLEPRAALMKGLSNYVCRRRYAEFGASAEAMRPSWARSLGVVRSWIPETETGDIGELAGLAEGDPIWREITSSSDTRVGATCRFYDECFVTQMKRDAEAARLVVVNHHLFFADLALRGPHPGHVIPDYDAVIFDEAHQLEDIATDFFGVRVSSARIQRVLRDAERAFVMAGSDGPLFGAKSAVNLAHELDEASDRFFKALLSVSGSREGRVTLEHDAWAGPLEGAWHRLDTALEAFGALAETARGKLASAAAPAASTEPVGDALELVTRRSEQLREQLAAIAQGAPNRVTWVESNGRSTVLSSSPIDLAGVFLERVFETIPAVVLTSATLASVSTSSSSSLPEGPFGYLRSRLGLSGDDVDVTELIVESPFDFENNALLYAPRDLPPPNDAGFTDAAAERIAELVDITGGGAFVLTTSLRSMRALHRLLVERMPGRKVLVQGAAPKSALVGAFRAAGDAVLVATSSFWEGVDVPGRALRLVVLEKIPFAVPSDPIVRARGQAIESAGGNAFVDLSVPAAAISLKQGFGRLIRTRSDRGIVALLDERVHRRGYGKKLLGALPPARRSESLEEVLAFWSLEPSS
jgi:ATP-dependent DNA helicase DinG